MHYVGCAMKVNNDDISINFLRSNMQVAPVLFYPEKDYVATVPKSDKLPQQRISGGH